MVKGCCGSTAGVAKGFRSWHRGSVVDRYTLIIVQVVDLRSKIRYSFLLKAHLVWRCKHGLCSCLGWSNYFLLFIWRFLARMEQNNSQTAAAFLEKHQRILVALPEHPTVDSVAAGLALQTALVALGKTAKVVTTGSVPVRARFLSGASDIGPLDLGAVGLVISLDTTKAKLAELSYDTAQDKTTIYLKAKDGLFSAGDVAVALSAPPFDVIVLVGVEAPEQLGDTFTEHAELFYTLPRLNIDVSPRNENYGTVNFVQVTTSSLSELMYRVLVSLGERDLVPPASTALLTGVLSSTDSLKNSRTTPDTFAVVADLIAAGSDFSAVVKHLFKTERLGFLKLWGRSLARLKVLEGRMVAYSVLLPADFEKTSENPEVAPDILAELQENVADMLTIAVAVPVDGGTMVVALHNPQLQAQVLVSSLGAAPYTRGRLDNGLDYLIMTTDIPTEHIEPRLAAALLSAVPTL